ncbi:hypothetical protein LZ31DRAFT_627403 [Colletotrichum somersetense]|nr:hypothetical protein LZ31DRAFT_627403 [Colletotrichum somersetense]
MSRDKEFPAWCYRVSRLCDLSDDEETKPHYFDEDISDLESESDDAAQNDAARPKRSFDGSDAGFYYELKELREERKRELRHMAKERREAIERDGREEEKARLAYEALKRAEEEGETLCMGSLAGKYFRLYSVDYIQHCSPLLLRLSRKLLFEDREKPVPESAPETFMFMSVLADLEKEKEVWDKRERAKREELEREKRERHEWEERAKA